MQKMYYDCPLRAAYMAKEFGVDFLCPPDSPSQQDVEAKGFCPLMHLRRPVSVTYSFVHNDVGNAEGKYYIHPDSMEVFKPIEGDLCSYEAFDGAGELLPQYGAFHREAWDHVGLDIIQRDDKAFFWPKKEGGE